jgi:hypothetical protein
VCVHIHDHEDAAGVRRILGVLSLAKKYGGDLARRVGTSQCGVSGCNGRD